jgi:hypothetical protein
MNRKRIFIALFISVCIHVLGASVETIAEKHGRDVSTFDRISSWPAWLGSKLVPEGHGFVALCFPLFFSVVFYAALSWLLIFIYSESSKLIKSKK